MTQCKTCSREIVYHGLGRPRLYCDDCRPARPRVPKRRPRQHPGVPIGCPLTAKQLGILAALANGRTRKQHALDIGRSDSTVRTQLHTAYHKLGAVNATHATVLCWKHGWLTVDGLNVTIAPITPPPAAEPKVRREDRVTVEQALYLETWQRYLTSRSDADREELLVLYRILRRKGIARRPDSKD